MEQMAELLSDANIDDIINDPNAREQIPVGHSDYRNQILDLAQVLTDASKDFMQNGTNSQVIDFEITVDMLLDMFFGTDGTVETQGDGGLLLHYYDPATGNDYSEVRQRIWNNLIAAHEHLRGRAPNPTNTGTVSENAISFRYDFLTAIRTVKADLPFERRFNIAGDAALLISRNSDVGCGRELPGGVVDEIYPRISNIDIRPAVQRCTFIVAMTDNELNGRVRWTLDHTWNIWNSAEMLEEQASTSNTFRIVVPLETAGDYRTIWIMAEDASGNSVVRKREITFIAPLVVALDLSDEEEISGNGTIEEPLFIETETFSSRDELREFLYSHLTFDGEENEFSRNLVKITLTPIEPQTQNAPRSSGEYRLYRLTMEATDENVIVPQEFIGGIYIRIAVEENYATFIRNNTSRDTRHGILLENAIVSDVAKISVITPEPATITLRIIDNLGNVVFSETTVRAGLKPAHTNAADNAIVWNLTNQSGRYVANGTYLIVVEATSISGRRFSYSARIGVNK